MAKTTIEQQIVNYRYILQKIKLQEFEDAVLPGLQLYLQTLNSGVKALVNAELLAASTTKKDLAQLQKDIAKLLESASKRLAEEVAKPVGQAGEYSYTDTNAIVSWDGMVKNYKPVNMSANQIAALALEKELAEQTLPKWLHSALTSGLDGIQGEVATMRTKGYGYKKILRELKDHYSNLVDSSEVKRNLDTVARSYIQAVNAKAHREIYAANRDLIDKVEWSAIMENGNASSGRGTCPRCMALDGQKFDSVKDGPPCPLHARCRCMYLPVTKSWKDLFGVDIEEEQIGNLIYERNLKTRKRVLAADLPAWGERSDKTYAEWWATKPKEWQDKAIGPQRAALIRSGKIKFKDLIDEDGDLIPIKELVK